MKKLVLCSLMGLFLLALTVNAETFQYPGDEPVFEIAFPDEWTVETEDELLHASPEDGAIYVGMWAFEDAENIEAALDALDEAISGYFTELDLGEAETLDVNEIPFVTVEGTGTLTEGETAVNISVALFMPAENQFFLLLYFGTQEAEEEYKEELISVVTSIKKS